MASLQAASAVAHQVLADNAIHTAGTGTAVTTGAGAGLLLAGVTWAIWRYMSSHRQDQANGNKKLHHSHRANTIVSIVIGLLLGSATAIGVGAAHVASMIP